MKPKESIPYIVFVSAIAFLVFVVIGHSTDKRGSSSGETVILQEEADAKFISTALFDSNRQIVESETITLPVPNVGPSEDVKHSIPIADIFGGGPPKDGIPSIDEPKFESVAEAQAYLTADSIGIGLSVAGESRFYPYTILVRHELVNDVVQGNPILVSYCPLCYTGVVFDRRVGEEVFEFGVSGMLWESNVLMYNRAENQADESLWSQVLGEAVLGNQTGAKLSIVPSDVVKFGEWIETYPETLVLSRDTGSYSNQTYRGDPYIQGGRNYYTSPEIWFGSYGGQRFESELDAKAFVYGIEVDGKYRAYPKDLIREEITIDSFAGRMITIEKSDIGSVRFYLGDNQERMPHISGFWFSWLAAHPSTTIFNK